MAVIVMTDVLDPRDNPTTCEIIVIMGPEKNPLFYYYFFTILIKNLINANLFCPFVFRFG